MSLGVQVGRFAALILVTVAAIAVMLASQPGDQTDDVSKPSVAKLPPTAVSLRELRLEDVTVTDSYSGMLHPWERFRVGFDSNGRVISLGNNQDGEPLDDGDEVTRGQVLAVLDQRMLAARVRETKAIKRRAEDEWDRAQQLQEVNPRAISDTVLLTRETEFEIASAQLEMAEEALDRSTLKSPVDGVISKRMVNVGEAVLPQQDAFEIVQDSSLLFTVGVPESKIRAFVERMRDVEREKDQGKRTDFEVVVNLIGVNAKGKKTATLNGIVRHVSRTSDDTSGMFTVEAEIKNDGLIRSGQIGVGEFKLDVVKGFRVPSNTAVIRDEQLVLFHVDDPEKPTNAAPIQAGQTLEARTFALSPGTYIEQQDELILLAPAAGDPASADIPRHVIVRGQHRLTAGNDVTIADMDGPHEN